MTSPELLQQPTATPSPSNAATDAGYPSFAAPSLLEVVRWIEANSTNPLALLERTDAGWSVILFDGDPPPPASLLQTSSAPFERRDRSRRRRG